MDNVLVVAVDESDRAIQVLERAIRVAERRGARLHVVNAFHIPWAAYAEPGGISSEYIQAMSDTRSHVWERLQPLLDSAPVPVEKVELTGYPANAIVSHAEKVDAQLIVLGNRGAGGLRSLLLGSTSHGVIHSAHCDVLIVKTETGDDAA